MKTIVVSDQEYREIEECIPYISDESYANRIAYIIADAIEVDYGDEDDEWRKEAIEMFNLIDDE